MLTEKLQPFYQCVHTAMMEVGNSAPRIADIVIPQAFPETYAAADREGAASMLRQGVINFLTAYLKRNANAPSDTQADFAEIDTAFKSIVGRLHNHSHYVPSLQEHMPIGVLIDNPKWLDEARKFKRMKGEETLAEADVLDDLFHAVTKA